MRPEGTPVNIRMDSMSRYLSIAIFCMLALVAAGCLGDDDSGDGSATTAAPAPTPTTEAAAGTTIQVDDSEFGKVLFDGDRMPIYLFEKEKGKTSECYGECATAWPPVLTDGEPQAGKGAKANLLGTTKRDDGKTQVTYNGHPLYYYEEPPGAVTCHNVYEFGGTWLVVTPEGDPAPA